MVAGRKRFLKNSSRWVWLFVLGGLIFSLGVRINFRSPGSDLIISKVNGEPVFLKNFTLKLKREELMRAQLSAWGLKIGPVNQEDILSACEKEALIRWITSQIDIAVPDAAVEASIKKFAPKEMFDGDSIKLDVYQDFVERMGFDSVEEMEAIQRDEVSQKWVTELLKKTFVQKNKKTESSSSDVLNLEVFSVSKSEILDSLRDGDSDKFEEKDIKQFYFDNKARYMDKGGAVVGVVELAAKDLEGQVSVSEKEIMDYYKRNKLSKYSLPTNYTVDFWMFEPWKSSEDMANLSDGERNEGQDAHKAKIKFFISDCERDGLLDSFKSCEERASEKDLVVKVVRNHKFELDKGRFSKKLESVIKDIKTQGEFSEPLDWEGKVYVMRLVQVETGFENRLDEVKDKIEETIRKKKSEYEVGKVANLIYKKMRECGKKINPKVVADWESELELQPGVINFSEIGLGEFSEVKHSDHKISKELSSKIDGLTIGKMGKVGDSQKEIIYLVLDVKKRAPKEFDKIKEKVEEDFYSFQAKKIMKEKAESTKAQVIKGGAWPQLAAEEVNVMTDLAADEKDLMDKLNCQLDDAKIILGMTSPKQVLIIEGDDICKVIKLRDSRSSGEVEELTKDMYVEDILVWLGKTAKIERASARVTGQD